MDNLQNLGQPVEDNPISMATLVEKPVIPEKGRAEQNLFHLVENAEREGVNVYRWKDWFVIVVNVNVLLFTV